LLSGAARVWADVRGELQDRPSDAEEAPADGSPVPHEEVRKVAKAYQKAVTKFGAVAAATKSAEDPPLQAAAEEVINSFTAAVSILVSLRRGACACFREELRDTGSGLATATERLGAAVGSADLPISTGKALDRAKCLERISAHNRAATRRRILLGLAELRDANRDLSGALGLPPPDPGSPTGVTPTVSLEKEGERSEEDTDLDLGDLDREDLEPHERRLVEAVREAVSVLEDTLKRASQACLPSGDTGSPAASISDLEAAAEAAAAASRAVDGLASSSMGGLDRGEFAKSLEELRSVSASLGGVFAPEAPVALRTRLDTIQEALDAAPTDASPTDS